MRLLGAILAGGKAERFGADKALACIDGKPLIACAIEGLASQVAEVVVCGRSHPPYVSLPDRPGPHQGPLGGLNAALHYAAEQGYHAVLSVGCDTPRLPDDLAERLVGNAPAALTAAPIIGFWPAALAPVLDRHLAHEPDRSMRRWTTVAGARLVALGEELPNINTRDDLAVLAGQ
jgi:molybdopterin-guanine dinucleotide biosynthesis protein A